jgi:TetR/AcrR family transcriptional regulator, transcriptional repressor for nem operon
VQDLVCELGVLRGSPYAAFGDKHDLHLKSVALDARENHEQLEAILLDGPVLPALRRMLLEPSALTGAPDQPRGAGLPGCRAVAPDPGQAGVGGEVTAASPVGARDDWACPG